MAQPEEEIIINAPLRSPRPTPPLPDDELPPFLQAAPDGAAPAGLGGGAAVGGARATADFIAYLEDRTQRKRIAEGVARVLPDDPPVRHPPRRRLYERRYLAALDAGAVAARRHAPPADLPAAEPDAPRWQLTERVLLTVGLGLAGVLGLVLVFSGIAGWVLSQGHAPPVRVASRPTPTAIAVASAPDAVPFADVAPPVQAPAAIRIIPPPTSPPVLASSISYAPPAAPADTPPDNPAPPPVVNDTLLSPGEAGEPDVTRAANIPQSAIRNEPAPPLPVAPTYDDPNIISGGSIAGQPPVEEPTPAPLAQGGGGEGTPQHPIYDDPNIISGGTIGGDGK